MEVMGRWEVGSGAAAAGGSCQPGEDSEGAAIAHWPRLFGTLSRAWAGASSVESSVPEQGTNSCSDD